MAKKTKTKFELIDFAKGKERILRKRRDEAIKNDDKVVAFRLKPKDTK